MCWAALDKDVSRLNANEYLDKAFLYSPGDQPAVHSKVSPYLTSSHQFSSAKYFQKKGPFLRLFQIHPRTNSPLLAVSLEKSDSRSVHFQVIVSASDKAKGSSKIWRPSGANLMGEISSTPSSLSLFHLIPLHHLHQHATPRKTYPILGRKKMPFQYETDLMTYSNK